MPIAIPLATMQDDLINLENFGNGANKIIYRAEAFFPLDLFPDSISVDKNKIDIVHREFFWTKRVFSILIEDLTTIKLSTGPVFATVYFEVRGYEKNPEPITYIKKADAIKLRNIVIGLAKAKKENINLNKVDSKRVNALNKIGDTHENVHAAM